MAVLNYNFSLTFLIVFIFSASICIAGQKKYEEVIVDNSLNLCIGVIGLGVVEDGNKVFLDTIWANKQSIGDCGCKSAAMSYSVRLIGSKELISYGIISSFEKENYKFLLNHDSSVSYKNSFKLSIGCSAQ